MTCQIFSSRNTRGVTSFPPFVCDPPLSLVPFGRRPLPLLLPQVLAAAPHNPSRHPPISSSPRCSLFLFESSSCWCKPSIGVLVGERRNEGRKNSRWSCGYLCICAANHLVIRSPMWFGRGAVQNFVGGRTAVVLLVSGIFRG
jgi:hypothetical protein